MFFHEREINSPANLAGILANLYLQEKGFPQISPTSIHTFDFPEAETYFSSIRQNITSILGREPIASIWYNIEYTSDTANLPYNQEATIETRSWAFAVYRSINVTYRNPESVLKYISQYPEIDKFINECWIDLVNYFGESVSIVLEIMEHNENEHYLELIGWIQSEDSIDEGLDKFDLFIDKWVDRQVELTGNKFNFNIEFK